MTRVFIAEKPSLAETIAKGIGGHKKQGTHYVCGNGDIVTWCFGHLMEQAPPESYDERLKDWSLAYLPVIPPANGWRKYVKKDAKQQFEAIRSLVSGASEVVNAGDADREGNLLVDEVLEAVGCKKPAKRLWLLSMDDATVKKSIASMKSNGDFRGYSAAAEGRSRADWMIGMNFTMGFTVAWRERGNSGAVHTGRVQTPTLWIVVTRDLEIENFKPIDYFVAKFRFIHGNGAFWVTWQPKKGLAGMDAEGRIIDRRQADDLVRRIGGEAGVVAKLETKRLPVKPPLPWNLSELQKEGNRVFGYSPDKVLNICQSLYETHKITTYPRTPCAHLPEEMFHEAAGVVDAVKAVMGGAFDFKADLDFSRRSQAWNDKKVGEHSHFGIIPNSNRGNFAALSQDEKNIYRLIVRNYLAQFCPDYVYDGTSVMIEAGDEKEQFTANGKVVVQLGWRTLFGGAPEADSEDGEGDQKLPDMEEGDSGSMSDGKVDAKKTKPPAPYNGGTLIDAMENAHRFIEDADVRKRLKKSKGIGTDATRAAIVKNLVTRGYIEEIGKGKKSFYRSSEKGRALIACLPDVIKKPDLTAYFEDLLQQVEDGELSLDDFTAKQSRFVGRILDEIKSGEALENMPRGLSTGKDGKKTSGLPVETHPCISEGCSGTMKRRVRTKDKSLFWVCEHEHFADDDNGKPVPQQKRAPAETVEKECPACGGKLRVRNGKRGKFLGCAEYPKCNYVEEYAG